MIVFIVIGMTQTDTAVGMSIVAAFSDKKDAEAALSEAADGGEYAALKIYEEEVLGWGRYRVNKDSANQIYDLLVTRAGADESNREAFVDYALSDTNAELPLEFRFQGDFGFGGKIYIDHGSWHLDYYHEDRTDELEKTRRELNKIIRLIRLRSESR